MINVFFFSGITDLAALSKKNIKNFAPEIVNWVKMHFLKNLLFLVIFF